jgi:hypothetical protein
MNAKLDALHIKNDYTHDPRFIIIVRLLVEEDTFIVILDSQSTNF